MRGSLRFLSYHASKKKARRLVSQDDLKEQLVLAQQRNKTAPPKVYINSIDRVADDYVPEGAFSGLAQRAKSELSNRVAESRIKKDLPGFSKRVLAADASALYEQYQRAFAARDLAALKPLLAPSMFTRVKAAVAGLPAERPGTRTEWEGRVSRAAVVTLRVIPVDELALNFAQATVRFESTQRLRVLDAASGAALRETAERAVQDTWVLERVTNRATERWHYLESLPLAEGQTTLLREQELHKAKEKAAADAAKKPKAV
jgi:predicted lipid-binding transport protein (Tim44 family)